jgi:hypothetical protein
MTKTNKIVKLDSENRERIRQKVEARKEIMLQKAGIFPSEEDESLLKPWPKPNQKVFYGLAGEIVKLVCTHSEADPIAVQITLLARFAAEVEGPFITVGDAFHYPIIFACLVGATSKARKGTSAKPVMRLFEFAQIDPDYLPAKVSPGPLSSGEGLIFAVRDKIEKWEVDKKTKQGQFVVIDPGVQDKRLFILDEEMAGTFKATKGEGNTVSVIMRQFWDRGKVEPLTKHHKIAATNPHVVIVSHITLHELLEGLTTTDQFNGFANRFLWLCVRRQRIIAIPQAIPEHILNDIRIELLNTVKWAQTQKEIKLDELATAKWVDVYPSLSDPKPGMAGRVTDRGEAYVLRLALIYALFDKSPLIQIQHLEAALALWDYAMQSVDYIFGDASENPLENKIIKQLLAYPEGLSMTDIIKLLSKHVNKKKLTLAIRSLETTGKVEIELVKTKGRPKKIIKLIKKAN